MNAIIVLVGLLFAACLQVEARSIGPRTDYEMPKVLRETMEQSFSCAMQLEPAKALRIPRLQGIQQLPEDNDALNELWGCIWKKKGIIDDNADVHPDKLEEYLVDMVSIFGEADSETLQQAHQMAEECKDEQATDYGLRSVKIQNCIHGYISEKMIRK